ELLAGAAPAAGDATAPAVVVRLKVGAGVTVAAGLNWEFAAFASAGHIAIGRVAAPPGVVADPRPVPAEVAGVAAPMVGRSWRPRGTRFRGGSPQERPRREHDPGQHRDRREDPSPSRHGVLHGDRSSLRRRREGGSYGVKKFERGARTACTAWAVTVPA